MTERQPIGDQIDALGVRSSLRDGDLITDACVVLKVVDADGNVRLSILWSEGMSWLERRGMLTVAVETDARSDSDPADL